MDLKNSAITAIVLIESLVHLLKNENVDISTVKITIGNKKDGIESPEIQLQQLIDISLKELLEIKNGEKSLPIYLQNSKLTTKLFIQISMFLIN